MADIIRLKEVYGVSRPIGSGIIASGSITWATGDNASVEKTANLSFSQFDQHPDNLYWVAVDKPGDVTAGALTIKVYNSIKIDGTNERDCLVATNILGSTATGTNGSGVFLSQGLGFVSGSGKIGMAFFADTATITCYYQVGRV